MAWERELFDYLDDLEGQAEAAYAAERGHELAERARAEYRSVTLAARLMASVESEVRLDVLGAGTVTGLLTRVAAGWCLVTGAGASWVVRLPAVTAVHGAAERAVPELAWSAVASLGLASALRRVAEAGEPCSVHLTDARRYDGTVHRVGADFVELATGESDRVVLVALDHVAAVRSRD